MGVPTCWPQQSGVSSLGQAVQTAAADLPGVDPAWLIERLGQWFSEWAGDGLFSGVVEGG